MIKIQNQSDKDFSEVGFDPQQVKEVPKEEAKVLLEKYPFAVVKDPKPAKAPKKKGKK